MDIKLFSSFLLPLACGVWSDDLLTWTDGRIVYSNHLCWLCVEPFFVWYLRNFCWSVVFIYTESHRFSSTISTKHLVYLIIFGEFIIPVFVGQNISHKTFSVKFQKVRFCTYDGYYLCQEGYVFTCIYLFVSRITQKVQNKFWPNSVKGRGILIMF